MTNNRISVLAIFLFFTCAVLAQKGVNDSIDGIDANPFENGKAIADLNGIRRIARDIAPEKAIKLVEIQLAEAVKSNNKQEIADASNRLGLLYLRESEYLKAMSAFNRSSDTLIMLNNPVKMAVVFANKGFTMHKKGNEGDAVQLYHRSLHFLENSQGTEVFALVNALAGQSFLSIKNYAEALEHFQKAYEILEHWQDRKETQKLRELIHSLQKTMNDQKLDSLLGKGMLASMSGGSTPRNIEKEQSDPNIKSGNIEENKNQELSDLERKRKELEFELKELQEGKNSGAASNIDGIADHDRERLISVLNDKLTTQDLLISKKTQEITKNELQIANANSLRNMLLGGSATVVMLILFIYIRLRSRKKAFRILELKNEELRKTRDKLKQSEHFKDRFLATMSHEIRTPMNAVMGMSNLLMNTNPSEQQLKYIDAIRKSSENLLVLLNDILDLSRIEAGQMKLEQIAFNLSNVIDTVQNTLKFKAEEKGIELKFSGQNEIGKTISGDPVRLIQILLNLVSNAVKFTDAGYVHVYVSAMPSASKEDWLNVNIKVSDTGIGIPPHKMEHIFDVFSQAGTDISRKYGGTGLGLAISKNLIELQGGSISVKSELGKGSEFMVEIPYKISEVPIASGRDTNSIQSPSGNLKGLRVLLAEDNEFNRIVAEDTLKSLIEDVYVEAAYNGKEAVDKLAISDFDIILMDLQMPEMNGYDATVYIRTRMQEPKNKTKILALTASATKAEMEKCFESGMDEYIAKPFEPEELVLKINKLVRH